MGGRAIVSVELLLDPASERLVREEWEALAAAGLSSMAAHTAASNRPHITLLVRPTLPALDARAFGEHLPLPLVLGAPVLFGAGDRRVLAISVVPTSPLLDLHTRLHALAGRGEDASHTRPGEWTPHVTLARRLRRDDLAVALAAVAGDIRAHATALRRWDAASATVTALASAAAG